MSTPVIVQANPAIAERGNVHIYLPEGKGPHPYVLGIHGGGWQNGDQSSYAFLWPHLKQRGIALVLVSYRLAPAHRFPAPYEDMLVSLAWLRNNNGQHGLDNERCMIYGSSAGGHLAMLIGARATAEKHAMPKLCGVVCNCGITDMNAQYDHEAKRNGTMVTTFMGTTPSADVSLYRDASPIAHVHAAMAPVWMAHGSGDTVVPVDQSRAMAQVLRAKGHSPIYLEAAGLPHTLRETTNDGKNIEPMVLLFEHDLMRFIERVLQ
ncbi:MAG: alpha/beta hydrolase [Spirochaetota bacterium]